MDLGGLIRDTDRRLHDTGNSASPSDGLTSHSPLSPLSRHDQDHGEQQGELPLQVAPLLAPMPLGPTLSDTLPRTLGGVNLEPKEIDEIFTLYFLYYAKHLPFLDPKTTPNSYYNQSPLLFWAIISAGTRRYLGNPTLLGSIAEPVLKLGWSSMHIGGAVIPNIQGLLILSTWPFPTNSTSKDNTFTLSGMSVNLALQIGLHVPLQGQDYSRTRVDLSNENIARRVQLWSYCVVVHQKAACALGYPITLPLDLFQRKLELSGIMRLAPKTLSLEVKLASIIGRMNSVLFELNFEDLQNKPQAAPSMMLDVFEAQLNDLDIESAELSDLEALSLQIARLQLRIYYLRCPEDELYALNLTKIYTTAIQVIEMTAKLDSEINLASFCPHHIYRMSALAASVLLRILKTRVSTYIRDHQAGRASYFQEISLLRKMSVHNNDMPGRMAGIFAQLWTSEKAFKPKDDGVAIPAVRIQSRLSMSLLHDTMWWWREEFGDQPYTRSLKNKDQQSDQPESTAPSSSLPVESYQANPNTNGAAESVNGSNQQLPDQSLSGQAATSNEFFAMDDTMPFLWDPIDPGFESMIELFPDSWPL
ncbi:Regulatory protein LEU3 [Lachnellula suecica]|uniref:Regulatory protein LEU3 n=1 Tax=Lachnellula suecica TaxID=602035 RepID=A0A8T9CHM0_9HELO|nr:Regulatory protein LEU3 [Lachnellula suecica]